MEATSHLPELAMPSPQRRQSLRRKFSLGAWSLRSFADVFFSSEMPGVHKAINGPARSSAWPIQGGLQSITNTNTGRNNNPMTSAFHPYIEVPPKASAVVAIVAETGEATKKTKTPSPKKVTIRVEPASGKENFSSTPQSSK